MNLKSTTTNGFNSRIMINSWMASQLSLCGFLGIDRVESTPFRHLAAAWLTGAVNKSGRGHRDSCVGTGDLGTRDDGLEDIKYGTRGSQIQGRRGRGMWIIIAKVAGKCDISHFPREYISMKATFNLITFNLNNLFLACILFDLIYVIKIYLR